MPGRIPAGSYGDQMPTIAFGTHPETGRLFIQGDLNAGGTGARPAYDGESGMIIFAGSTARNNPVEVVESRNGASDPRYALRPISGAGTHRGGSGSSGCMSSSPPPSSPSARRKVTGGIRARRGRTASRSC
jgi:N-methylhydantoinase B